MSRKMLHMTCALLCCTLFPGCSCQSSVPTVTIDKNTEWALVSCSEGLDLRLAPQRKAEILAHIGNAERVQVLQFDKKYSLVHALSCDVRGYVPTPYLVEGEAPLLLAADKSHIGQRMIVRCEESLALRAAPSLEAETLHTLRPNDKVTLLGLWDIFAHVRFEQTEGYVLAGYLVQDGKQDYEDDLSIITVTDRYSYETLQKDLLALKKAYPSLIVSSIGKSELGRDIPVVLVGDPQSETHILVQATVHAREHLNTTLVMGQLERLAKTGNTFGACIHIVPMANPDGVDISLLSELPEELRGIYEFDKENGYAETEDIAAYLSRWKANGRGVDLNRNFDARWDIITDVGGRSSFNYKGSAPEDQAESRALADYARSRKWAATLSYHAFGSVIYWDFPGAEANVSSWELAMNVARLTDYSMDPAGPKTAGGFKDWAVMQGIPSLTIEIGTRNCPLPLDEFPTVWLRNRDVLSHVAQWAVISQQKRT